MERLRFKKEQNMKPIIEGKQKFSDLLQQNENVKAKLRFFMNEGSKPIRCSLKVEMKPAFTFGRTDGASYYRFTLDMIPTDLVGEALMKKSKDHQWLKNSIIELQIRVAKEVAFLNAIDLKKKNHVLIALIDKESLPEMQL